MNQQDVLNIPEELCPMMVFSYGIGSPIATAIAVKEQGWYNHFMWALKPGWFASQAATFRLVQVEAYLERHALKFVYNKDWTEADRVVLRNAIETDLKKPWWKRLYDPVAILGQLFNLEWLQIPGIDICSDKGKYLKLVNKDYNLKHPSPTNINTWSKGQPAHVVYGRYRLD